MVRFISTEPRHISETRATADAHDGTKDEPYIISSSSEAENEKRHVRATRDEDESTEDEWDFPIAHTILKENDHTPSRKKEKMGAKIEKEIRHLEKNKPTTLRKTAPLKPSVQAKRKAKTTTPSFQPKKHKKNRSKSPKVQEIKATKEEIVQNTDSSSQFVIPPGAIVFDLVDDDSDTTDDQAQRPVAKVAQDSKRGIYTALPKLTMEQIQAQEREFMRLKQLVPKTSTSSKSKSTTKRSGRPRGSQSTKTFASKKKEYKYQLVSHPSVEVNLPTFDEAPPNLMELDSKFGRPFRDFPDKPLADYDTELDIKSMISLQTQASTRNSAPHPNGASSALEQKENEIRLVKEIKDFVNQYRPLLKNCYEKRVCDILSYSRMRTRKYLEQREQFVGNIAKFHHQCNEFEIKVPVRCRPKRISLQRRSTVNNASDARTVYDFRERERYPQPAILFVEERGVLAKSTTYFGAMRNIRVDDDPILRYIPYFGDNDQHGVDLSQYEMTPEEEASSVENEIDEFLLRMVVNKFGYSSAVFDGLKEAAGFVQPQSDYIELKNRKERKHQFDRNALEVAAYFPEYLSIVKADKSIASKSIASKALTIPEDICTLASKYLSSMISTSTVLEKVKMSSHGVFNFDPHVFIRANYMRNPGGKGLRKADTYEKMTESYRDIFCRMCYIYDCNVHGVDMNRPLLSDRYDPRDPPFTRFRFNSDAKSEASNPVLVEESIPSPSTPIKATPFDFETAEGHKRRCSRSATVASSRASASLVHQRELIKVSSSARVSPQKVYTPEKEKCHNIEEVCSFNCYRASSQQHERPSHQLTNSSGVSKTDIETWESFEKVILLKCMDLDNISPCMISRFINTSRSCEDINVHIKHLNSQGDDPLELDVLNSRIGRKRRKFTTGNSREELRRTIYHRNKENTYEHEFNACNHDGPCGSADCSCIKNNHFCEKTCPCPRDCSNRFSGCKCTSQCQTNACPCFKAGRECDPDLCFSCGAYELRELCLKDRGRWTHGNTDNNIKVCANLSLQRRIHKKVGISRSSTHGWGAFALEPICKNEFVYEYCGALISQDEAERRGKIYDKMKVSFLFDLNEETVVDATRKGNKMKFANHDHTNANCNAKILIVQGNHRIAIFAKRDIKKGEELFFDYGYAGESAPVWSQVRLGTSANLK